MASVIISINFIHCQLVTIKWFKPRSCLFACLWQDTVSGQSGLYNSVLASELGLRLMTERLLLSSSHSDGPLFVYRELCFFWGRPRLMDSDSSSVEEGCEKEGRVLEGVWIDGCVSPFRSDWCISNLFLKWANNNGDRSSSLLLIAFSVANVSTRKMASLLCASMIFDVKTWYSYKSVFCLNPSVAIRFSLISFSYAACPMDSLNNSGSWKPGVVTMDMVK